MSYKAFLSSTFEDLKTHREFVIGALRRSGFVADPMEEWGPAPEEPKVFSQERIEGCDVFVLLVAFRRGYVPEGEDLSITQLEYQAAREFGVDVLAFVLEKDAAWPRRYDELEKDRLLVRWRGDLMKAHGVRFFYRAPESIDIEPALTRWTVERQARQEAARSSEEAGRRAEAGARATAGSFDRELESIERKKKVEGT